jgi:HEAT repeat protein
MNLSHSRLGAPLKRARVVHRYDPVAFSIRPLQRGAADPARPRVATRIDFGTVALIAIALAATGFLVYAITLAAGEQEPESAPVLAAPVANAAAFDLAPLRTTPGVHGGAGANAPADARIRAFLYGLDADSDLEVRRFLEREGVKEPDPAPEAFQRVAGQLLHLVKSPVVRLRRGALAVLARMDGKLLDADPFTEALGDASPDVRRQAVVGCGRHDIERSWRAVVQLAGDRDERVRATVATALTHAREPDARRALARMLRDDSDFVVDAAATALGQTVDSYAVGDVAAAARSPRSRVRLAAARVLVAAHTGAAVPPLVKLAADPVWEVRREAIVGLGGVRAEDAPDARTALEAIALDAKAPQMDRFEAIQSLASLPAQAGRHALGELAGESADVVLRLVAARTEVAQGDETGIEHLVALLGVTGDVTAEESQYEFVRATAARTLRDVTKQRPRGSTESAWRELLPAITAQFVASPPEYVPERLVAWWK